jgi:hypothetical protein
MRVGVAGEDLQVKIAIAVGVKDICRLLPRWVT